MLLEEFDSSKAVIEPSDHVKRVENFPETVISCFSKTLFDKIMEHLGGGTVIGEISGANGIKSVYKVEYKGEIFGFFNSSVGEPVCCADYEEIIAMGCKRMILFGTCGVLDKSIDDCSIIIPTLAIRDEGLSYHYKEASVLIETDKKYRETFKALLKKEGLKYVAGTTWTTDAFYRETPEKVKRRKAQGAISVEMECAGMQAVADYRGVEFFEFFYAADNLDGEVWDKRSLANHAKMDEKSKIALLAFDFAVEINDKKI